MTHAPPGRTMQSRDAVAWARRPILWVIIGGVLVLVFLALLMKGTEWKAAADARNATPVGSATFAEIGTPSIQGVWDLTGKFVLVDNSGRSATYNQVPFGFVDPIPSDIGALDLVQVTCRVRWSKDGIMGPYRLRVDVCRDIVLLSDVTG